MKCEFCGEEKTETTEGTLRKEWNSDGTEHQCSQLRIMVVIPGIEPFSLDMRIPVNDFKESFHVFCNRYLETAFDQIQFTIQEKS
jgi:hypothetical protein